MKKLLSTTLFAGLALGAYAQGRLLLSNWDNPGWLLTFGLSPTPTDTVFGLFWLDSDGPGPIAPELINTDFNVSFYGGSHANDLILLKTLVNSGGGAANGPGTFVDLSLEVIVIPGALTSAFFRIEAWIGGPTLQSSAYSVTSPVFMHHIANPNAGSAPVAPVGFDLMSAMVLTPTPEPSTFALVAIGAGVLLFLRRR